MGIFLKAKGRKSHKKRVLKGWSYHKTIMALKDSLMDVDDDDDDDDDNYDDDDGDGDCDGYDPDDDEISRSGNGIKYLSNSTKI